MSKKVAQKQHDDDLKDLKILIIDDNSRVLDSIHFDLIDDYGFRNISFARDGVEAEKLMGQFDFEVISSDYNYNTIEQVNGVGLLKFLTEKLKIKRIIYTTCEEEDLKHIRESCDSLDIEIIRKSDNHENLIKAIETHYYQLAGLPPNPRFAYMNDKDLLLTLSMDLIKDLSSMQNPDDKIYFSNDTQPVRIADLIDHIRVLSPLGKEYLGMWFNAQRKTFAYYERLIQSKNKP